MQTVDLRVIHPHFTLAHDSLNGIIHALRRIFVLFQQPFDQAPHSGSRAFFLLPVYCAVLTKQISKLLRDRNKLVMLIEIFDGLRFCERIVESKLVP